MTNIERLLAVILVAVLGPGCAGLPLREPVQVTIAGLEPLPAEGLEARFAVKLRVQNPNETAIDFDGVAVALELDGKNFGSGVSDQTGTVPRYGETLITVPVTVPVTAIARQLLGMARGEPRDRISYQLRGHLGGAGLGGLRFDSQGQVMLPQSERRSRP